MKTYIHQVKVGNNYSDLKQVRAGVPQGTIIGPTLRTLTYDTGILATDLNPEVAAAKLEVALNKIEQWVSNWRIKVNPSKSSNITFTLNKSAPPPVPLNDETIPVAMSVKYLGLHLDSTLTWAHHITMKTNKELSIKLSKMR